METCVNQRSIRGHPDVDSFNQEEKDVKEEPVKVTRRRTTRNESEKRRRDKLNVYITELAAMVPMCASSRKKLDKTTVLQMAVNYMKIHNDLTTSVLAKEPAVQSSFLSGDEVGEILDECMNGFLFALSSNGAVTFISRNVFQLFGHKQEEVIGKNFLDLIHPDDRNLVFNKLSEDPEPVIVHIDASDFQPSKRLPKKHTFDIQMSFGKDGYCPIHVCGYSNCWESSESPNAKNNLKVVSSKKSSEVPGITNFLVAVGLLSSPDYHRLSDLNESCNVEFNARHTMDGKFLYVDPQSIRLTGFWPSELLGTSLYTYVHMEDLQMLGALHESMLEYGESKSGPYRMRCKDNQWIWLKSRSYVSYNHWNSKPEFFCSTNQVVSSEEGIEGLKNRQVPPRPFEQPTDLGVPPAQAGSATFKDPQESNLMLMTAWANDNSHNLSVPLTLEVTPYVDTDKSQVQERSELSESQQSVSITNEDSASTKTSSVTEDEDNESTSSLDLTMSFEELESFIEAQRQLHEQLYKKHAFLETAIVKQRQQLQDIQQQMLLNLQAQLTLDPAKNKELFETQLKKTRELTEKYEKQVSTQKQFVRKLADRKKIMEKRNQRHLKHFFQKRQKLSDTTPTSSACAVSCSPSAVSTAPQEQWASVSTVSGDEDRRQPVAEMSSPGVLKTANNRGVSQAQKSSVSDVEQQIQRYQTTQPLQQGYTEQWHQDNRERYDRREKAAQRQQQQHLQQHRQQQQQRLDRHQQQQGQQQQQQQQRLQQRRQLRERQQRHLQQQQQRQQQFQRQQQQQQMQQRQQLQQLQQQQQPQQQHHQQQQQQQQQQQLFMQGIQLSSTDTSQVNMMSPLSSPTQQVNPIPLNSPILPAPQQNNTLQNIQNLLTISSQNPEAMQMLLSGLGSQPQVAQTLLNLLRQAQSPGASLAPSMQQATSQFSAAINSNLNYGGNPAPQGFSLGEVGQQITQHTLRENPVFNRQVGENSLNNPMQIAEIPGSQNQRVSWSATNISNGFGPRHLTPMGSLNQASCSTPHQFQPPEGPVSNSGKHKDKKDYFSNFSSQELEAMFLTPEQPLASTSQSHSGASGNSKENKLQEEQYMHSPLLIQQQHLLQMHEDQRKQVLLLQQQEQLFMLHDKAQEGESRDPSCDMARPQLGSRQSSGAPALTLRSALTDQPSTSASASSVEGPSSRTSQQQQPPWSALNYELNDADEQVLNMLLAESTMDPMFEASLWPEDDQLSSYLDLNPDLNPD
ncbi:circadian locomoter output cycles protein kaput [Nematostella vectensis]|uniref:circadian locomoter output cycles protein kaput n=1 Tax=Nematostella vectensis TaxID=45351 RepID=UPI0020777B31|nr:circadian locomoter output cycles protein kaput [Nematostella vectensis]